MSAEEPSEVANAPSPGAQLRKAREQAGISLQSISERTLISTSKLQALERDDFSAVGGTAHVTGYTKAYARALGLDAKVFIGEVESALAAEKAKLDAAESLATIKVDSHVRWVYPALIVILFVLLALWAALWLMNDNSEAQDVASPTAGQQQGVTPSQTEDDEWRDEPNGEPLLVHQKDVEPASAHDTDDIGERDDIDSKAQEPQSADTAASEPVTELNLSATAVVTPAAAVKSPTAEVPVEPEAEDQPSAQSDRASTEDSVAQAPEPAVASEGDAPEAGQDQLQLVFIEDCWLEVSDATGKTMVADLAKAGQSRTLTGAAPFKVLLGDATAAALILFNEESVPFAPRPGQRVLRMTIGG